MKKLQKKLKKYNCEKCDYHSSDKNDYQRHLRQLHRRGKLNGQAVLAYFFGLVALAYLLLIIFYSLFLKNIAILDVLSISLGFVLRAVAGSVIINVLISPWLLICTTLLALFLALAKRRHELVLLEARAAEHRAILKEYTPRLLDQMISVVTASTLMAYSLYTIWPETVDKFQTENLLLTIPFVLYGIFRYLYLIYRKDMGGSPEIILIKDKPLILNLVLWFLVVMLVLYWR